MKKSNPSLFSVCLLCGLALVAGGASTRALASPSTVQRKNAFNTKPVGRITPWEAMQIAAKASGGTPFQAVYEFDDGQWIYGVVVVKNHKLMEVELDPTSGKIGETENVSPEDEAKELRSALAHAAASGG